MPVFKSLRKDKRLKTTRSKRSLHELVMAGYTYVELNRIREQITASSQKNNPLSMLITSPDDNMGNTLLVSLLGLNCVSFTSLKVLLIDLNLRHPCLHHCFQLKNDNGFTQFAKGDIDLKGIIKKTSFPKLRCITTGEIVPDISHYINRSLLENFIDSLKGYFNLILFDTSPLLTQNRNNVDPSLLSLVCDHCYIVVRDRLTSKSELQKSVETIPEHTDKLSGIIYNLQH